VLICQIQNLQNSRLNIPHWQMFSSECWAVLGKNGAGKRHLAQLLSGKIDCAPTIFTHTFTNVALLSFESQQAFYEQQLKNDDTDFLDHQDPGTTVRKLLNLTGDIPPELHFLQLEKILDRGYRFLSSGESRKALLAQAILHKPDLLILDEPFDSLDLESKKLLALFFQQLLAHGKPTLLFLLNSSDEIFGWHSHVAVMEKGTLLAQGERDEVLSNKDIQALLAFDPTLLPPWPEPLSQLPINNTLVELRAGHVSYGETLIFQNIDLSVTKGSHTLVTGANGSGKSTLLNLITGDHPQCYGNDLQVFGHQRGSGETIWEIKKHIGLVSPGLHRDHRVPGSALHIVLGGFFDSIGLYADVSLLQIQHAKQWLALVGLTALVNTPFKHLSYGEQRLVLIARALVKQPLLLILDEPTQGLDEVNRHRVMYFLEHLSSQTQTTIIMASHRMDEHLPLFTRHLAL